MMKERPVTTIIVSLCRLPEMMPVDSEIDFIYTTIQLSKFSPFYVCNNNTQASNQIMMTGNGLMNERNWSRWFFSPSVSRVRPYYSTKPNGMEKQFQVCMHLVIIMLPPYYLTRLHELGACIQANGCCIKRAHGSTHDFNSLPFIYKVIGAIRNEQIPPQQHRVCIKWL